MLILIGVLLFLGVFITYHWMSFKTRNQVFDNLESIPKNKVGLVLGTAKHMTDGTINLYYKYRIDATVELYKAGKIEYVLVSGDNSTKYYDEPFLQVTDEHFIFIHFTLSII